MTLNFQRMVSIKIFGFNWEQSYPFDSNFSSDSAAQVHRSEKQKLASNLSPKSHYYNTTLKRNNMIHEYYDEDNLRKCNVSNLKQDNLSYSRESSIDQPLSPHSCQSKETLSTSIHNSFMQIPAPKVVDCRLNSQAENFEYSNNSSTVKSGKLNSQLSGISVGSDIDIMVEDILTSTLPKSKQARNNEPRKDLVNKNIIRIISRFFKAKFKECFPEYSFSTKNPESLINLLQEF